MEERFEKNIWPHPPLMLGDLINELVNYFKTNQWFPHEWVERKNGELIDDTVVIEKINENKFVYRARAADPINLKRITAKTEKVFNSAREVSEYYIRHVLNLPGDLDGWKVIEK